MSQRDLQQLPLYLSAASDCAYLPGLRSRSLFVDPQANLDTDLYSQLARLGFRRSGRLVYRPRCDDCRQCLSVRVPVADFSPQRRFRRILRSNQDVSITLRPREFVEEHYNLYQRYTVGRHPDGNMQYSSAEDYADFLLTEWCHTHFIEFRADGQLVAVAVTDQLQDGLSAVYTFFDPDRERRSPGVFSILTQIDLCRELQLPYLYLGYWIRDCRKMSYKSDFRPLQVFSQGQWREFARGDVIEVKE